MVSNEMAGLSLVIVATSFVCARGASTVCLRPEVDDNVMDDVEVVIVAANLVVSCSCPLGHAADKAPVAAARNAAR